ncbi:MarR family winged helix-turn-helix transcriptional regulator [Modestobacter marinus]|uniref:MarR family winged helix-turn-helix transcriptional regulator n=1 Tax=Modestobacter marinus TaxID=477641 RepID=UPI001C976178|nr:MarR family transcriptional regulator [Modestobacter marinus]
MHLTPETSERLTAGVARLTRTARQLGHRVAAALHGDLPSYGWAMLVPLEQGGPQRCSALAAAAGVDVSVASRQVAALERAGYVARQPDPRDGRASLVSLSAVGVVALARTRAVRGQWAVAALDDWTEGEAQRLAAMLEKLADGLDRAGRRPVVPPSRPPADAPPTAAVR